VTPLSSRQKEKPSQQLPIYKLYFVSPIASEEMSAILENNLAELFTATFSIL
jgi:hypothetical protein